MKNLLFVFLLFVGLSATFASNEIEEKVIDTISECCTVTVEGPDGDATVRKCRTTRTEACDAAYDAAKTATEFKMAD